MYCDGGFIVTPGGVGRFVSFDPTTGEVVVEMDYTYLVAFPGDECYPLLENGAGSGEERRN